MGIAARRGRARNDIAPGSKVGVAARGQAGDPDVVSGVENRSSARIRHADSDVTCCIQLDESCSINIGRIDIAARVDRDVSARLESGSAEVVADDAQHIAVQGDERIESGVTTECANSGQTVYRQHIVERNRAVVGNSNRAVGAGDIVSDDISAGSARGIGPRKIARADIDEADDRARWRGIIGPQPHIPARRSRVENVD